MQKRFMSGTFLLLALIVTAPSPIRAENEAAWSAAHEGVLLLAMAGGMQWADFSPEQQLVEKAELALKTCAADGVLGMPVPLWVREAKALFVVPEAKESSFEEYSEGTNGVLLVRDEKTDAWSQPAFYTIDQARVIEQVGKETSDIILIVRTQKGLEAFVQGIGFKLGSDATMAAGPIAAAAAEEAPSADIVGYAKKQGTFVGIALENTLVAVSVAGNETYYGKRLKPAVIVSELSDQKSKHPRSIGLRDAAAALMK
jgi:SH3 domain-containing YSC84-like protein 1